LILAGLDDSSINSLALGSAFIDVVGSIDQNFWFNDGDQSIFLADSSVPSQSVRVFG
jgi:hypothetical protein